MITKQSEAHYRLLSQLPVKTHTREDGLARIEKPRRYCTGCKAPIQFIQQYLCTECRKKYDAERGRVYGQKDRKRENTWLGGTDAPALAK